MDNKKQSGGEGAIPEEVAKVLAADSDLKADFSIPPGSTIRLLGQPILAFNHRTNNATIPAKFLKHPLIRDRHFFALPQDFWNRICGEIGKAAFDNDLVELEDAVGKICRDCSFNVGLRSGTAFSYSLLRLPHRHEETAADTKTRTKDDVQKVKLDFASSQFEARRGPITSVAQGYAGWLLTSRQFLDEHDSLFSAWDEMVRRYGLSRLGVLLPEGMLVDDPTADPNWPRYSKAFEEFFIRWRLRGMAAPYLPIPLDPLMAGNLPVSLLSQLARAGGVFCLPDTFPIPSRDELRNLLEGALHGGVKPDHLTEWMGFIAKDNAAKRPIARFGRLFQFQHYYRILYQRHARALRGKSSVLKEVLAHVLKTSEKTIKGDLGFVRERLDKGWRDRGQSSTTGPF